MLASDAFHILLDPVAGDASDDVLDLPAGSSVTDAALMLDTLFTSEPDLEFVHLTMAEGALGTSSRRHLARIRSAMRGIGDSDGATLPGESAQFVILRYRCPVCSITVRRIHLDLRVPPRCPRGHPGMERII